MDLERKNIKLENLKDRITFMAMFNDRFGEEMVR